MHKTANQKLKAQEEEEELFKETQKKELAAAKEWEMLRQLQAKEMAHSSSDLNAGLQTAAKDAVAAGMSTAQQTKGQMSYLKRQRKFLFLVGVPADKAPYLKRKLPSGKKVDYTPTVFCDLLGETIDALKNGDYAADLKPIEPIDKKLEELCASFRNGTTTAFMAEYLEAEKATLQEMVEEVRKDVGMTRLLTARAQRTKTVKPKLVKLTKGMIVWVADINDADMEADEQVWEAKVEGATINLRGSWDLAFRGNPTTYHYPRDCIFVTEEDAQTDLLV